TSLNLNATGITADVMKDLAESPFLKRLQALELSGNAIQDSGIVYLAVAEGWESLREFKGYGMGLSEQAAWDFANVPSFTRLETAERAENWRGDWGVDERVHGVCRGWRRLALAGNQISEEGAETLARSSRVAQLEELELRENAIGARGVRALANSPHLGRLR